ncbi:MAG: hypothetical protein HC896_16690 [Bacteroidales bacterium]|nr:hypothetical protein [Bacteroidales bacterium]
MATWQKNINHPHPAIARQSMYNMVLGFELLNEFDRAIVVADQYRQLYKDEQITSYIKELEARQHNTPLVNACFEVAD